MGPLRPGPASLGRSDPGAFRRNGPGPGYEADVACYVAVVPPVSDHDRAYLARLGALKDASHREAAERHRSLSVAERLDRSWALYLAGRETARMDLRHDDPSPFYARARALGLLLS